MRQPSFFSNPNLRRLGIPAAAVTVMTLILSRGNFIAAIGAGIGTATSVYVTNYRLMAKTKFLAEKIKDLEKTIEYLQKLIEELKVLLNSSKLEQYKNNTALSQGHYNSLQEDYESLKGKLNKQ
ncbi:MAG: hypothetical protein QNJ53_30820 [Pleurocapsa sp. MO_192.B19]|nr:hypothetical protein [Pleurocapsa sp. MO_192.B19]